MSKYRYQIREVATGRTAIVDFDAGETVTTESYWWLEGNFGCDCNRRLEFIREAEKREPEDEETPCGEGAYVFDWVEIEGGVRFIENDKPCLKPA